MSKKDICPLCKADLTGARIPQKCIDEGWYAPGETHYSRKIAIYNIHTDRTVGYRCPDCGDYWDREFK